MVERLDHWRGWKWAPWVLVLLAMAGAAWLSWARGDSLRRIRHEGVVRVGYAVEAPYAFLARGGRITGASVETARLVAARLGWRIQWVQTDFDDLIPDLLSNRFDLVAAGMFVTPQRERLVRFSVPELQVQPGLLVRRGNPKALRGPEDLKAQARGAVLAGSVEELRLRALGVPALVSVPDADAGTAAVDSGLVDALVLSLPTVRAIAGRHSQLQAVAADGWDVRDMVANAFRPDDRELLAAWNAALAPLLASPQRLDALATFGFTPHDVPRPRAAAARS